jgi:hypothetical protein
MSLPDSRTRTKAANKKEKARSAPPLFKLSDDRPRSLSVPQHVQTVLKSFLTVVDRCFYFFAPRHFTLSLFGFISTVITARLISYYNPHAHWELQTVHLHHFTFGIFALAIAGYGALIFTGPRAPFFIALLYGFGVGLTFDEFDMWLNLSDSLEFRWSVNGILIVGAVILIGFAVRSVGRARSLEEEISIGSSESDAEVAAD